MLDYSYLLNYVVFFVFFFLFLITKHKDASACNVIEQLQSNYGAIRKCVTGIVRLRYAL